MFPSNSHRRSSYIQSGRKTLRNDHLDLLHLLKRQDENDETGKDETFSHNPIIPKPNFLSQEVTENSSNDSNGNGNGKNGDIIRQGLIGFGIVLTGIVAITMIIGVIAYIYRERLIRRRRSKLNAQKVRMISRKNSNHYRSIISLYTDNFKKFNEYDDHESSDMTEVSNTSKNNVTSNPSTKIIRNISLDSNASIKMSNATTIETPNSNIHPISSPIAFPSASMYSNERASSLANNIAKSNVFQATRPAPPAPVRSPIKTKQQKNLQRTFQIHSNTSFALSPEGNLIHPMPTASSYYVQGTPPVDTETESFIKPKDSPTIPLNMSRQDDYIRAAPSQNSLIPSFPSPPSSTPSRYSDYKSNLYNVEYENYLSPTESAKNSIYILDGPTNLSEVRITTEHLGINFESLFSCQSDVDNSVQQLNNCFESHKHSKEMTQDKDLNHVTKLKDDKGSSNNNNTITYYLTG
ncbi:5438_t:CDS:1, partial [Funneliformis geosporum]|uniref:19318_t:CDS:1 n=1 Tax=Funneliformis geosporum TaxID=1117311 RepID=A0A9W4WIR5_9GLOM